MNLTAEIMRKGLEALERMLPRPVRLIIGGGGAMVLAHGLRLATTDIDAVPAAGASIDELAPFIKAVGKELALPPDWLNPYYSTFTHVLPSDYGSRLIRVLDLPKLKVDALAGDDLLIMKCFAARQKDTLHARMLIRQGARMDYVKKHLQSLREKKIAGAEKALGFLEELQEFFEEQSE